MRTGKQYHMQNMVWRPQRDIFNHFSIKLFPRKPILMQRHQSNLSHTHQTGALKIQQIKLKNNWHKHVLTLSHDTGSTHCPFTIENGFSRKLYMKFNIFRVLATRFIKKSILYAATFHVTKKKRKKIGSAWFSISYCISFRK